LTGVRALAALLLVLSACHDASSRAAPPATDATRSEQGGGVRAAPGAAAPAPPAAPSSAAPVTAHPARSCGVSESTVLTETGIGDLQVGRPVAEVAARCAVLRDTTEIRAEGLPARIVTVDLGRDTVEAEAVDARVWRIALERPAFRTADSLGVGTPLARLLRLDGVRGMAGEDGLYVRVPAHCGLSFRLSRSGNGAALADPSLATLRRLPADTRVERVLVVGCAN
jgi:hypothetical protein